MIITLTGAQSTGKTTLLEALKKNSILADKFTFVESFTRKLQKQQGVETGKSGDMMQKAVLQAHLDNLKRDNVFLDRCLLDGAVYTRYYAGHGEVSASVVQESYRALLKHRNEYDLVFYLKPEFGVVADGVRPTSSQFQQEVAELFDRMIKYMRNVVLVSGSVSERVQTVLSALERHGIVC